jgi:alkyldihydroxyacetonephosphate synthase
MEKDWWKWGDPEESARVNKHFKAKAYLEELWQTSLKYEYEPPDKFQIEPLAEKKKETLKDIFASISSRKMSFTDEDRLKVALGKSYYDIIRICKDDKIITPDVVLSPTTHDEIEYIIKQANDNHIKVIPIGGGTNVVGALTIQEATSKHNMKCTLNLLNYNELIEIDEEHMTATFQAGILGPELEHILNERGYTLGHFPQSFEYSSLGGWVVTRSAGQESSYYGKIEDLVEQIKVITPIGTLCSNDYTHDAAGVNLLQLFVGSEGVFGVVSEVKIKIKKLPTSYRWVVAVLPNFEAGTACMKELAQNDIKPSVVRLSDARETDFFMRASEENSGSVVIDNLKKEAQKLIFQWKKLDEPCVLIMRFIQHKQSISASVLFAKQLVDKYNGMIAPSSIGTKWAHSRFRTPYLRDTFVEHGVYIDTMETLIHWNDVHTLYEALTRNLRKCKAFNKEQGILLTHISHIYPNAACMYFTLMTEMHRGKEIEQWHEIKDLVSQTIVSNGGSISHHHSVGADHQQWYLRNADPVSLQVLKAVKKVLDPNGILNPGKLFT